MKFFRLAGLLTGLVAALAASAEPTPDLIIHNARITAFDGARFSAVAIRGDRIAAVGGADLLDEADAHTRTIDARGHRLIPGLNDSHLHVVRGGRFYNLETRWEGVDRLSTALELLRRQAERTPVGQWVRVIGGWTPFQFAERRMPTVDELNEVAPDTPVFVLFLYSGGLLNRAGLEALGIDAESTAPPGSRFERDASGNPTGLLVADPNPAILYRTIAKLPALSAAEQLNSSRHFYHRLLSLGLTSAVDAGGGGHRFPDDYAATAALADTGELPLRVSAFLFPQDPGRELAQFEAWTRSYRAGENLDRERPGGYVIEGGGELLVWSASDYENFTAKRPDLKASAEEDLAAVIRLHAQRGWPFRIHATYDESISRMLDVLEKVNEETPFGALRRSFDHVETIPDEILARVKALGGGIAVQGRMAFAGEHFADRYGEEQARRSPPLRRMLDLGIPVALGTDGTRVASFNPWDAYYWAVSGRTIGGRLLYDKDNRLDRLTALRLFTLGSAWMSGDETRKGAIRPQMLADIAVLDRDVLEIDEAELRGTRSRLTIVGGRVEYSDGTLAPATPLPPRAIPEWSPTNLQ